MFSPAEALRQGLGAFLIVYSLYALAKPDAEIEMTTRWSRAITQRSS